MKKLKGKNSPLIEDDESNEVSKSNYQRWRKIVMDNMDSVSEFRRIANEANDLEQSIYDSENFISERQKELGEILEKSQQLQTELDQARILLEHSKSWQRSADDIASKSSDAAAKEAGINMKSKIANFLRAFPERFSVQTTPDGGTVTVAG